MAGVRVQPCVILPVGPKALSMWTGSFGYRICSIIPSRGKVPLRFGPSRSHLLPFAGRTCHRVPCFHVNYLVLEDCVPPQAYLYRVRTVGPQSVQ